MKKTTPTALFALCLSLMFISCLSEAEKDEDSPEIASISPKIASVSDTIKITFDEKIDDSNLKIEKVKGDFNYKIEGSQILKVWGKVEEAGLVYFDIGKSLEFDLVGLEDETGNKGDIRDVSVKFLNWVDEESLSANFKGADTLRAPGKQLEWTDGTRLSEEFVSEGKIITNFVNSGDPVDFKLIAMKPYDTLDVTVDCPVGADFQVDFFGPYEINDFNDSTSKNPNFDEIRKYVRVANRFSLVSRTCVGGKMELKNEVINYGWHKRIMTDDREAFYVIRIATNKTVEYGFYKLSVRLRLFK